MTMMRWFSSLPLRVRTLFKKKHVEEELNEELMFHVEHQVEALIAQGVSPVDARRIAMKSLGGVERQMERCRDVRAWQWVEILRADVVFGWRQLKKRKVTTTAAVVSLALGIGACTAAFRLVDALFLRPLPITHPERLYEIQYNGVDESGKPSVDDGNAYPQFIAMRESVKGQAELVAASHESDADLTFGGDDEMEKAGRQFCSGWMFAAFGLRPAAGRLLTEDDDRVPGGKPYVVISYDYWTRRFGRDPSAVGRTFRMNDAVYEIVGVAPKGFTGTQPGKMTDVFVPMMMNSLVKQPDAQWFRSYLLAPPGVPVETLLSRLDTADHLYRLETWKLMSKEFPNAPKRMVEMFLGQKVTLMKAANGVSGMRSGYGLALLVLSVLAAMVLLIACVNVANLMAGQAAARAREMALRVSLGAGRWRLMRLVLAESVLVGVIASALGLIFAWWATPFVTDRISTPGNPMRLMLAPDWRVMTFGMMLTVGVTTLFGLAPALRASRVKPASALKGGEEPHARLLWMQGMIAAQVAFCFMVLFAAGLFVRTFQRLTTQPLGFSTERILVLETMARQPQLPVKWEQMTEQLSEVPGVERASLASWGLLSGALISVPVSMKGEPQETAPAYVMRVSPGWLETMKIPLIAGRDLNESDTEPGQAVVNEAFAKRFFAGTNPVGQSFALPIGRTPGKPYLFQVVGLVRNAVYSDVRKPDMPTIYEPMHGIAVDGGLKALPWGAFIVRTKGEPEAMAQTLRRVVMQANPEFRVGNVSTQEEMVVAQTVRERLLAALAGFFAVVALLLAAIGLYGVLHYSVVQREKEIGIRIALGAAAGNIARLITVRVMLMVVVGAVVGLAAGMASVRYIAALLYGVKATDPSMLMVPAAVLLAVACLAALPAVMRAVQIDPAVMLRAE
jgi:predicted permease